MIVKIEVREEQEADSESLYAGENMYDITGLGEHQYWFCTARMIMGNKSCDRILIHHKTEEDVEF